MSECTGLKNVLFFSFLVVVASAVELTTVSFHFSLNYHWPPLIRPHKGTKRDVHVDSEKSSLKMKSNRR